MSLVPCCAQFCDEMVKPNHYYCTVHLVARLAAAEDDVATLRRLIVERRREKSPVTHTGALPERQKGT